MQKAERELRATVKKTGLSLLDINRTGGGHLNLVVEAPNGATKRVTVSANCSDRRATANNEAILRRFARENAPANDLLTPLQTEPAPVTPAATPAPPPETTMTATRNVPNRNQLTDAEKFRLYGWLKDADLTGIHTKTALVEFAINHTNLKVTIGNIEGALKVVGRELPPDPAKRPKAATPNERILARSIVALMTGLGQEPGDDLRSLAE